MLFVIVTDASLGAMKEPVPWRVPARTSMIPASATIGLMSTVMTCSAIACAARRGVVTPGAVVGEVSSKPWLARIVSIR